MKYIVDMPSSQDYSYDEMLHMLKLRFYDDNLSCRVLLDAEPYTEPERKAIEDEVWGFANFLENKLKASDYDFIFDDNSPYDKYTYQEAKAMYEEWLKQKDEIKVGDEVFHKNYPNGKLVVTRLYQSGYPCADILFSNGETDQEILVDNLVKTGRHFDEVEVLLKKIGSE